MKERPPDAGPSYVSRAGLKLQHALDEFKLDVTGMACADFGCNVGGFTDCLLKRGADHVHALDTGYGVLDYRLRTDDRVTVMERTNALHAEPPPEPVDLVVIDLAWTPQRHAVPAALRWLGADGRIVSLLKPHYELDEVQKEKLLVDGCLDPAEAERVAHNVADHFPTFGATVTGLCRSPLTGAKSGQRRRKGGNIEFLVLARPA